MYVLVCVYVFCKPEANENMFSLLRPSFISENGGSKTNNNKNKL